MRRIRFVAVALAILIASVAIFTTPVTNAANATVTLTNFSFSPKTVRIKKGESVTWVAKEGSHTVTADKGAFDSGSISAGKSFSHTFDKPGTYKYFCSFHGSAGGHDMAGTVIVTK